jgi:DNA polymerase-1
VKIDFDFATAQVRPFDFGKILPLYRDLEFKTLIKKHSSGAVASDEVASADSAQRRILIVNESGVETAFLQFGKQVGTLGVLFAQQNADLFGATLAAICVSNAKHTCVITNPTKTSLKQICDLLSRAELVVVHDAKTLMRILGETISVPIFDTMIASYLLNAGTRSHDLSSAIHSVLGGFVPEMPPTFSKQKDYEAFGKITSVLPELGNKMRRSLEGAGVLKVFDEIESPLTPILYKMENAGIKIDTETLARLSKNFEKKIEELDKKIQSIAGVAFNVNSPSQLADVLFTALKLPTKGIKKTKTGFSTAAPELDKLWDAHEIIPMLSEYRELAKLQSTYVEALPKLITKDGRVHTTYNQTVTATGRLSSSEPNLQNIPVKTELGREIRKAFVAPRGKVLLSADYSQIELRLVAVLSRDAAFINAFKDGSDIHTRTAAEVWGVTEKNVTKQQRAAAKAINFGIIYGMGPRSLARATGFSVDEAQQFIDRYFEIHHSVRDYLDATKLKAHAQGFVETYFGRRRYLPEIESGVQALVSAAERMAINMPVQGTAADIMKMAMLRVDGWLSKSGFDARMLLQVHDEIVLEVDENFVGQVALGVREMMESVAGFEVPLVVDVEEGKNWGEMERVE